nr:MFS transporter [Micromonospora sp. DSM 115978]
MLALAALPYTAMQSMVAPALPTLQAAFDSSPSATAWLLTSFLLSASVATPIVGRLGDVHGKRRVLLVTLGCLVAGTVVCAVATSLPAMIVGRLTQGVAGAVFPLSFGLIRDAMPSERIGPAIGLMSTIIGIGGGLGVVLTGPILDNFSYNWLYWFPLLPMVVALVGIAVVVPESPVRANRSINWVGALALSATLAALLAAVSQGATWGWSSPGVLGLVAASALTGVGWVRSELRSDGPLVDMRMLGARVIWTTNLAGMLVGFGMYSSFVLVPQLVQFPTASGYGLGRTPSEAGLLLLPSALIMLVA